MKRQQGAELPEFAVVGAVFFMILFFVIELGRVVFAWETLVEATRRGARIAAVCPFNHGAIEELTVSGDPDGDGYTLYGLSTADVSVAYLNEAGDAVGDPVANPTDVFFVRVRITGYRHQFIVPLLAGFIDAPTFETVLPTESLGAVPTPEGEATIDSQCYGATI